MIDEQLADELEDHSGVQLTRRHVAEPAVPKAARAGVTQTVPCVRGTVSGGSGGGTQILALVSKGGGGAAEGSVWRSDGRIILAQRRTGAA